MNKLKKLLLISSALLLSTANNTFAGTDTVAMSATGTITGSCSVAATTMAFTLSTSGTAVATSDITPTCTNGTSYSITNASDTNYLYLGGNAALSGSSRIAFPIKVTATSADFVLADALTTGKLIGTGNGSAQARSAALTGTAESGSGKVAGVYTGTVNLTITF